MLSSLPLIHRGYKETFARVSAAFAVLFYNVNQEGKVEVNRDHVRKASSFLTSLLTVFEHPVYVQSKRMMLEITDEEWSELQELLTGKVFMALRLIGENPGVQVSVLQEKLGVERRTILNYTAILKGKDLIESARGRGGGYELTQKGAKTLRRFFTQKTELEKIDDVKNWILENRKDGTIDALKLADFIQSLGLDPRRIIDKFRSEGLLFEVPEPGKWGVSK